MHIRVLNITVLLLIADHGWVKEEGGGTERKKKRRSRWGADESQEKTVIPGMPTILPCNLSKEQEQQYLCKLDLSCKVCIVATALCRIL